MRARHLPGVLLLLVTACKGECELDAASRVEVQPGERPEVDVEVEPNVEVEVEREVEVEVEVQRTVCDELDFVIERIVRVPPNFSFNSVPVERVSLRVTNHGSRAAELRGGSDARFLDERRTVIDADLHGSEWFMSRTVPARGAVVVEIVVAEGMGKALRTVEAQASPEDDPFTRCTVTDDLKRERVRGGGPPAAEGEPGPEPGAVEL
ncbi:hypothetical protein [Paraliomyxa miuraensis]|uniref:hypothetical protein n=1 Tax=Paraliomyxa miuraensis TaxID=376150 RepID=UPI00224DA3CF|nr:hypothetical protein [Paraliomyxa miuraensis]MCX4247198.1 hypothetical protein [Paraliomyxa miuraensis]